MNTLGGDRSTIHQLEVTQVIIFATRNIAVHLVLKLSFTNTQRKPSPPSVESKEIMTDNFLNILIYCIGYFSKKVDALLFILVYTCDHTLSPYI